MQHSMFLVDDIPYCVWEWNLWDRNREFLDQIDHDYFRYIAETHCPELESENAQRAAIILRTSYHHALETFFTLLFAAFQAPDCAVGYVHRIKPGQIRKMIQAVNTGTGNLFNKQGIEHLSWGVISDTVNLFSYEDKMRTKETKELYSKLWTRLGHAYLDDASTKEYNSIKHGFRVKAGGFTLLVGTEPKYGISPPPEEMKPVGGSKFGTSFFCAEYIDGVKEKKYEANFRVRRYSINWNPKNVAHALIMLSMSINNVISYMKIINGVDAKTVLFTRPQESEYFEEPCKHSVGILNINIDSSVSNKNITSLSREEIRKRLKIVR